MRIFQYLILGIITIVTPYLMTMIFIIITGDRYQGMRLAILPGLISVQLIFGMIFIKKSWLKRIPIVVLVSAIAFGFIAIIIKYNIFFKTSFDMYGFWDLVLMNFIVGLLTWEIYYHVDLSLSKRFTKIK